ncbi:MAG TPA: Hpt domain-containing protein [Anaerolineales bacterium]|nr:Hpt domain-containing protein [Anaerolineales bacterium]HMX19512.1 Hpt domain-containing protein [Anaerolineales bacterium]HMX73621.1 Hpt domain-containing protein [Anaerolineales bacterium]HMZ43246.1 Hpt domain-containing protein [Anaerolineales bacterium]HNA53023.1 Hpt domain-containing protein [Anaerolineales bacterium]
MSVIDLNTFTNLKETVGADFIGEMIDTFLEDALTQIGQMKSGLAAQDVDLFRRAAHSLKSNAATFGATELAGLARELEMLGREKNLEIGNRLEVLQDAFEQVRGQLLGMR